MENILYSSVFGDLTKVVQARIDAASAANKLVFGYNYYEDKLAWDTPTVGLNFEELIGKYNLDVAAATLGEDSKEPIRGYQGLETIAGRVFKHAHTYPLTIQEYRKILGLLDSRVLTDEQRKAELVNVMWNTVTESVNGVRAKIDMIFLNALSNGGVATLDATNNPESALRTTIDYKMPAENKKTLDTKWIATGENATIATADVLADIMEMQDLYADKSPIAEIWLSQSKLNFILRAAKMKEAVFGTDRKGSPLMLSNLNEFMQLNDLPVFRVIKRQMSIQGMNGKLTPYTPWNSKNLVFVPAGTLGVIKNAYADSELRPEAGVAYSNDGRIRIAQWGVGETQNSNGVEFTKAEVQALPVFTAINGIYQMTTEA